MASKPKPEEKNSIVHGVDPQRLWSAFERENSGNIEYLKSMGTQIVGWMGKQISYLGDISPQNILGGAQALWENLSKGNFGFFKDWVASEETPFIAKAAGLAATAGSIIVGGIVGGKAVAAAGARIATTSLGKFLSGAGVSFLFTRQEFITKSFNLVERVIKIDWTKKTETLIKESVKRLQDTIENLSGDMAGVVGRSIARIVVDRMTDDAYLEVDRSLLGYLSLSMGEDVMEDIYDTFADIGSNLYGVLKDIATEAFFLLSRDWIADVMGVESWKGDDDASEFTISGVIKEQVEKVTDAFDIPAWVVEAGGEGISEVYSTFREQAIDKAGIIRFV